LRRTRKLYHRAADVFGGGRLRRRTSRNSRIRANSHAARGIHFPIAPRALRKGAEPTGIPDRPLGWQEDPLILFVASLVYYTGVDVLLRATAG